MSQVEENPAITLAFNLKKLPALCKHLNMHNPVGQRITILTLGSLGYTPFTLADGNKDTSEGLLASVVRKQNLGLDVTSAQMMAMFHGSMFGFHVPLADADNESNLKLAAAFDVKADAYEGKFRNVAERDAYYKQALEEIPVYEAKERKIVGEYIPDDED